MTRSCGRGSARACMARGRASIVDDEHELTEGRRWLLALALVSSAGDVDLSQALGDDLCDEVLGRVLRAPTLADVVA